MNPLPVIVARPGQAALIPRGAGVLASAGMARVSLAGETFAQRLDSALGDELLPVELRVNMDEFVVVGSWDGYQVTVAEPAAPHLWRWLGSYPDPQPPSR